MNRQLPGDYNDNQNDGDTAAAVYRSPGTLSKVLVAIKVG